MFEDFVLGHMQSCVGPKVGLACSRVSCSRLCAGSAISVCALKFPVILISGSVSLSCFYLFRVVMLILLCAPIPWAFCILQGIFKVPLSLSICIYLSW